jgi:uncharacterized heparinase superfamily protein
MVAGSRPIRSSTAQPVPAERLPFGGWLLGSALYSLTLGRRSPHTFFAVAPDSWPGDAVVGMRLVAGELMAHGQVGAVTLQSGDPPWRRAGAGALWLDALNGFAWLRDLRDCGDPSAAALAGQLVDDWSEREWRWSPHSWKRDVLAARIVNWIRHYDWLAAAADAGFPARFVLAVGRQRAHLRALPVPG